MIKPHPLHRLRYTSRDVPIQGARKIKVSFSWKLKCNAFKQYHLSKFKVQEKNHLGKSLCLILAIILFPARSNRSTLGRITKPSRIFV